MSSPVTVCQKPGKINTMTQNNSSSSSGHLYETHGLSITHHDINDNIFAKIKAMCEHDIVDNSIDMTPQAFASHRRAYWPFVNRKGMGQELAAIYSAVASTGLPNSMGARIDLPTKLIINVWSSNLTDSNDDVELLSFLRFGFPLGYMGPVSPTARTPNHRSATDYGPQVQKFIDVFGGDRGAHVYAPIQGMVSCVPPNVKRKEGVPG